MNKQELEVLINNFEKFILKIIQNAMSKDVEDAVALNRQRDVLQTQLLEILGLQEPELNPTTSPDCPECGGEMLLRSNRQNGEKFWGCKKYPNCRGTRDSAGLSREERRRQQDSYTQQSGFSFSKQRSPATEVGPVTDEKSSG